MGIRFDKEKLSFITKKVYQDEVAGTWKQVKKDFDKTSSSSINDLDDDETLAILNRNDLTNSNNEIEPDDRFELNKFPPIVK